MNLVYVLERHHADGVEIVAVYTNPVTAMTHRESLIKAWGSDTGDAYEVSIQKLVEE